MMAKEGYKEVKTLGKDYIIPEEWSLVELNEVLTVIRNGSSKKQNQQKRGLPISRIETISDGIINYEKVGYLDIEPEELKKHKLKKGDILFSHINSVAHIGKVAQYEAEKPLYHGMNLLKLRFDNQKVKDKFMLYRLKSKNAKQFYERYAKQAVNQASLNQNDVGLYPFPLPPQKEQKKIADILSSVDENIEKTDQVIEKTKELKKGLMQQLLTKGIGHDEFKEVKIGPQIIRIPKDWKMNKLDDLTSSERYSIVDGPFGSNLKTEHYKEKGVLIIQSNYFTQNKFAINNPVFVTEEKAKELARSKVETGDIVMAKIGANYGNCDIVPENIKGILSSNCLKISLNNNFASSNFYKYLLKVFKLIGQMEIIAASTAQPALTLKAIRSLLVPVPPLEEQKKIANILSTVDEKIQKEEEYKSRLERLKKGLMQKLLTGEVRVNVDDIKEA